MSVADTNKVDGIAITDDNEFSYGIIQIQFMHDITDNAEKFLQAVQDQVGELGIKLQAVISDENQD